MRSDFLSAVERIKKSESAFTIATVIRTEGSASARSGSRAIFNSEGKNVFGWIGGGCAEKFVAEHSLEVLKERRSRIVTADLDDEIFGLGVACGGRMDLFIEPIFAEEVIQLPDLGRWNETAEFLARGYGWRVQKTSQHKNLESLREMPGVLASAISKSREKVNLSLRDVKDLPVSFPAHAIPLPNEFVIVGKSRIVEALARWGVQLGIPVRVFAPSLNAADYPEKVRCECLRESYEELQFSKGCAAIIASHHAEDASFVEKAIAAKASYVGMVGSRKRALEIFSKLSIPDGTEISDPLYVPAGLDLDARTPEEIALSIVAEIFASPL